MTPKQFNEKWKDFLEPNHYGMDICTSPIIEYVDKQFEKLSIIPGFKYAQIKVKYSEARCYTNLYSLLGGIGNIIERHIEKEINVLLRIENEVNKRLIEKKKV